MTEEILTLSDMGIENIHPLHKEPTPNEQNFPEVFNDKFSEVLRELKIIKKFAKDYMEKEEE